MGILFLPFLLLCLRHIRLEAGVLCAARVFFCRQWRSSEHVQVVVVEAKRSLFKRLALRRYCDATCSSLTKSVPLVLHIQ